MDLSGNHEGTNITKSKRVQNLTFVSFVLSFEKWGRGVPQFIEKAPDDRAFNSFPLTGKDEGRGDGFDRGHPYPGLSPSRGKEMKKDARHNSFSSSGGERKIMKHFVVKSFFN
jgi:hypothetical protein